jgi:hypothetical protein
MDWRTSTAGFDWASQFIKENPGLPVILTTHELVGSTYDDNVYPYGQTDQPGHGSPYFDGGQNPLHGAYLTTGAKAPLNTETFKSGFTIEAFVKIPLDWNADDNSWMSALSRWGEAGQAGKGGQNTISRSRSRRSASPTAGNRSGTPTR